MRVMVTFRFPTESGNEVLRSGRINTIFPQLMADLKPEAAYLYPTEGQRGGHFIVDMQDAKDVFRISERIWLGLGANVEVTPVMRPEDIQAALGELGGILEQYG